jgi:hypothetical protein
MEAGRDSAVKQTHDGLVTVPRPKNPLHVVGKKTACPMVDFARRLRLPR